jgi:hypothetical protein
MNLEQIKPENIKEILNQIRLSIESDLTKSIKKRITVRVSINLTSTQM